MPRITKVYTRAGDGGMTRLGGGQSVPKDDLRIEAYGTVDELNSQIGQALAAGLDPDPASELRRIQNELLHLGADLSVREEDKDRVPVPRIEERHVEALERTIDRFNEELGPLENFILPGGTPGASRLHVARTVCRRAERLVVRLARDRLQLDAVVPAECLPPTAAGGMLRLGLAASMRTRTSTRDV